MLPHHPDALDELEKALLGFLRVTPDQLILFLVLVLVLVTLTT